MATELKDMSLGMSLWAKERLKRPTFNTKVCHSEWLLYLHRVNVLPDSIGEHI